MRQTGITCVSGQVTTSHQDAALDSLVTQSLINSRHMHMNNALLDTRAAAQMLGVSAALLNKLRCTGDGPVHIRIGRRCLYDPADLQAWVSQFRATSTSQAVPPLR